MLRNIKKTSETCRVGIRPCLPTHQNIMQTRIFLEGIQLCGITNRWQYILIPYTTMRIYPKHITLKENNIHSFWAISD